MSPFIIPIVAIICTMGVLPIVIVGGILSGKFLRIKERELALREAELEIERERIEVIKLTKAGEALDKVNEIRRG